MLRSICQQDAGSTLGQRAVGVSPAETNGPEAIGLRPWFAAHCCVRSASRMPAAHWDSVLSASRRQKRMVRKRSDYDLGSRRTAAFDLPARCRQHIGTACCRRLAGRNEWSGSDRTTTSVRGALLRSICRQDAGSTLMANARRPGQVRWAWELRRFWGVRGACWQPRLDSVCWDSLRICRQTSHLLQSSASRPECRRTTRSWP